MTKEKFAVIIVKSVGTVLISVAVYLLTDLSYWRVLLIVFLLIEGYECVSYAGKKGDD